MTGTHIPRRPEVLATWPPCPACNPLEGSDGLWSCATCNGLGRVPPSPPSRTAVATDDGRRRCAYPRCQAGGDILPGAPSVEEDGRHFHPGCLAASA